MTYGEKNKIKTYLVPTTYEMVEAMEKGEAPSFLHCATCLDGLTNGEVLMKMFPKWEVNTGYRDEWYQKAVKVDINPKNDFEDNKMITLDWWNAKWGE